MKLDKVGEFVVATEEVKQVNTQKFRKEDVEKILEDLKNKTKVYTEILAKFE